MGFLQLLAILWARRLVILGCFLAAVALGVGLSVLLPKSYRAAVTILIDHDARDPYVNEVLSRGALSNFLGKQGAIIKSDRTAHAVMDRLRLAENAHFKRAFGETSGAKGKIEAWIAAALVKGVEVRPHMSESVIEVAYSSADPDLAATIANAFADAYMHAAAHRRGQGAGEPADQQQAQARTLQIELSVAEQTLRAFQERTGLTPADTDLDSAVRRLEVLTKLYSDANAETAAAAAQLEAYTDAKSHGRPIGEIDGLGNTQLLRTLRAQISTLFAQLIQIKTRYGTGHPDYTSGMARMKTLTTELDTEVTRLGSSLEVAVEAGRKRVAELDASINDQKTKVVGLQSHWDEYQNDLAQVKAKREALARATQSSGVETSQGGASGASALVLTPATAPQRPNFPNPFVIGVLALGIGLMLGIVMAILVELTDRRIRSSADVEDAAGASVIVVLPKRA